MLQAFLLRGARHASHDIFFCVPLQSAGCVLVWDNLKSEKGSTFAVLPYIQVTCEVTEHRRTSDAKDSLYRLYGEIVPALMIFPL